MRKPPIRPPTCAAPSIAGTSRKTALIASTVISHERMPFLIGAGISRQKRA